MSAIKKGIKKIGRFVKKHWKKIVIAAAVVFTAGIATVGVAGLKGAVAAKGVMGGIGATMKAGVLGIGKTLGIGKGVTAATSGGVFASAPALAGATATTGVGLGSGAAAQAIGLAPKAVAPAAATAAAPAAAAPAATQAPASTIPAEKKVGFMNTLGGAALIQGGIGMLSNVMAGKARDEEAPKGYYGVDLQGNNNLAPDQLQFMDAGITGGMRSFRRPLMYDNG